VILAHFEAIVCAVLLMADAAVDGDEVVAAVAERWVRMKVKEDNTGEVEWRKEAEMDRRIFLGNQDREGKSKTASKL
jgi:hypothetical protein